MFLSFGFTARSAMRPETIAGPMLRSARPANVSAFHGPAFLAAASDLFDSDFSAALSLDSASSARSDAAIASATSKAATDSNEGRRIWLDTMASPDDEVARAYARS